MKIDKNELKDIIGSIFGILFIVGFIVMFVFGIKQCTVNTDNYYNSLPTYHAMYGSFLNGRLSINFETYKVENNHYTFFDSNGNLIGDFTVSGNNQISIYRNRQ